jgi:hypothetical protein
LENHTLLYFNTPNGNGIDPASNLAHLSKGKLQVSNFFPATSRSSIANVQGTLGQEMNEATHALMPLPLDVPALELLATLLEKKIHTKAGVDALTIKR